MSDQLNDFINAQHQTNIHLSESMARMEGILSENSKRLFGGDGQPGALPKIYDKLVDIEKRTTVLELWKTGTVKWVAGVIAELTLEGSALALYFAHITGRLHR